MERNTNDMSNYSLHLVGAQKCTAIAIIDNYRIVAPHLLSWEYIAQCTPHGIDLIRLANVYKFLGYC